MFSFLPLSGHPSRFFKSELFNQDTLASWSPPFFFDIWLPAIASPSNPPSRLNLVPTIDSLTLIIYNFMLKIYKDKVGL